MLVEMQNASGGGGGGIDMGFTVTGTGQFTAQNQSVTISTGLSEVKKFYFVGHDTNDNTGIYTMLIDYDKSRNKNRQMALGGNASSATGYGAISSGTSDAITAGQTYATVISAFNGGDVTIKAPNSGWYVAARYYTWYAG